MKRFQSPEHAERFLSNFQSINAPFRRRRHLLSGRGAGYEQQKHFVGAGKRFGIPVLTPAELLEKMREGNQSGD
jgi:hypothetical protein